jgi:mannan endo-1,4-beta-mannosidase
MRFPNSTHTRLRTAIAPAMALALVCLILPAVAPAAKAKQRPLYWGAWIGKQITGVEPPWDMSAVTHFEGFVHKSLSLIEFASPFYDCNESPCRPYGFPTAQMQSIRDYGAIPFFSWSSDAAGSGSENFRLAEIAAGRYDSYIREFADASRQWGHPYFLRFNWEMNGSWFPWSEDVNGNQPGDFVAAWRHVHDIFTAVGATNATWVWCPYAYSGGNGKPLGRYYPGHAYVDWTCMDAYNWAANPVNPHPWQTFDQLFDFTYRKITKQIAPGKPLLLGEVASAGDGKAKARWIKGMFRQIAAKYRQVRGLIWFDEVDRGVQWPIETAPAAGRAFSQGLRKGAYRGNRYGELSGAPIRPAT